MAKQFKYDVAKQGPLSWRDLQEANNERFNGDEESQWIISRYRPMSPVQVNRDELLYEGPVQSPILRNSNGRDYWGKSMWDEQVADANDFYNNLSDLRGQNQPWYAQLGAGLLKGVTTFATTWLDGTVGLLYGVGSAIHNGDNKTGWDRAAQIFHNDVSNALQDFNEFMEEFAPNYKSRDEENNKWYQNMGTMNFWADGLIKNLGFTVGAFYSGGAFTKAIKGVGGLIAAGKAGRAAKAYKAAKVEELMKANPKMTAEEAAKTVSPMAVGIKYTNALKAIEGARSGTGIAVAGSLFSAVNEGRIEANQVYRDAFTIGNTPEESKGAAAEILAARNRKMQEIEDNPTLLPSEKQALQAQVNANSQKLLAEAEQNAAKAGMLTLGLNIPILTIDNFKMYGRLYSRGFKQSVKQVGNNVTTQELKAAQDAVKNATTKQEKEAAKRALRKAERKAKAAHNARNNARIDDVAENVTDKEGRLAWNEITKGQAAWKGVKSGLMEGNEEMMQALASGTAGNMTMPEDPDAYYKALTDPNATVKTNDFLTSVTKGFLDSYGNGDRWEEGAIGFLTGILGMPTFGAKANSDSNTYLGRGKMIGLSGGFFGEFSNANYLNRLGAESVKNLNAFRDKYKQHAQFLAQSQAFTNAMDGYLQDKNEFAYNNARDNDDYAMIQALAVTGRIDEVKAMLNFKEEDLTDEILDSIANDFTENSNLVDSDGNPKTVDDKGKPLQGAWRDKAGNLMSNTKEGKAEMKAKLLEKQKRLNEEIDDYVASLDSVRAQVNNSLDESQVRELAWLDWKNKQWSRRFQDVQEDQNKAFKTISSAISQALDAKNKDGNPVYTDKDTINKLKELQEFADKAVSAKSPMELYTLSALDGNLLHKLYAKVKGEKFDYDVFDIISNYISDNNLLNTIFESLYDIRQMALAQHQFNEKLKEYTSDPSKLAANRQRIEEERQQAQSITDDINTRKKLKNMSVKDYMDLSDEDKEKVKAQARDFDDDDIKITIEYGDEIDEKTEKMLNKVYGDEDTDETTKKLLSEAIAAMKDKAEKPEQITVHSEAYLEWRKNKLDEYKKNGKYEEGLEALNGLDEYLLNLMGDFSDDDSDFEDEDFDDGDEPEDFDDGDVPPVDDFDDDSTGHDATTSVPSVREKQKKDKKKEEKKKKKEEELTYADKLWKRLTDIAPEGREAEVESTAKPIREKLEKTVNDLRNKGVKQIASGVVTTFKAGIFPSESYKELEQIIGDKTLLEKTIKGIINDYVNYINGILAKEVADNKAVIEGGKKKVEEPEEEVRTPAIPESEIDTYAESQNKNRSGRQDSLTKNYWLPRTTQYGIGSTEFSKPEFDENGRQLKYWERVNKNEGNYSPRLRAKIVTVGRWLDEHGVFDNVDGALNKTLKEGTEISFTTNQELNDLVANAVWEADNKQGEKPKPVIILMAVGEDLHIVGDMAEPDLKNLGTQEKHLAAFVNDFNKRYGEWLNDTNQDHSKPFVHPMKTKVHQGLIGRMIYNEKKDRNTLNSIFGDGIILGVALRDKDSGKLDVITNPNKSKKDAKTSMENDILPPQNPKAGQPYVVVPSLVSGKYICVPFTIPSLSEVRRIEGHENFGLIKNLNDALAEIASIDFTKDNVDTELIAAKDKLESILNVNLWLEHKDGKLIIKRKADKKYVQIYAEPVEGMKNFAESIITEFEKAGVGFQVDRKKINKGDYNRLIGEIANTNLPVGTEYHTKNDWFTVEPINVESGKRNRIPSNIKPTGSNPNASDKIITVTRTAKDKSVTVTVDLENDTVSYTDSKGKLQVIPKSDFGNKENAHKAWAYAIGQSRYFKGKPNKNTLPYQTKNNDEYFDPVNYVFLASKEEFDDLCQKRSTLPKAVDTLEADLKKSVGKNITVTVTDKSKSGYPIIEIQRTDGDNGVYTNKFRVSEDGDIESAAGWASDNPANWEVDNSVTNRGGDTISFTPVLDFYKTLGFTPKPAPTTTQTTTEQQTTNGEKSYAEKSGFVFRPVSEWKQEHSLIQVYPDGKTVDTLQFRSEVEAKRVALTMLTMFKSAKDYQDLHNKVRSKGWSMPVTDWTTTYGYWEAFKDGRISEQDVLDLFTPNSNDRVSVPTSTKQETVKQTSNTSPSFLNNINPNNPNDFVEGLNRIDPNGEVITTEYEDRVMSFTSIEHLMQYIRASYANYFETNADSTISDAEYEQLMELVLQAKSAEEAEKIVDAVKYSKEALERWKEYEPKYRDFLTSYAEREKNTQQASEQQSTTQTTETKKEQQFNPIEWSKDSSYRASLTNLPNKENITDAWFDSTNGELNIAVKHLTNRNFYYVMTYSVGRGKLDVQVQLNGVKFDELSEQDKKAFTKLTDIGFLQESGIEQKLLDKYIPKDLIEYLKSKADDLKKYDGVFGGAEEKEKIQNELESHLVDKYGIHNANDTATVIDGKPIKDVATAPQVSEQAPSTEITREEREEIIKNNQVQLPSDKFPSGNNNIGGYLAQISNNEGGSFGRVADTYDGSSSYYRMFDVNGDTAKFEFYAPQREQRAMMKWSSILDTVADYDGDTDTADTIFTVEAGEVKKNSNGRWVVTKRAKLQLVKKEDIVDNVYTDTEAVKRDIDSLQRRKNEKRQDWENQRNREQEQQEQIKEDFDDSFDVEEASPEVEQAIGEVIQGTNLGLSIDEVFKQNNSLEQLYNSNPQFKDSVDSLRKVMEENKQKEEEQKAKEQQIAEEPAKTPDDIVKEYLEKAKDKEYEKIWNALSNEGKKKFVTNYAKDSKTFNSKMREIKKFWNKKEGKFTLGGEPKFRVETKQDTTKWNREEEMAWLKRALPQLSNEQRVQIVDGLIKIKNSDNPGYAWGQFCRGLITISSEAASGTLYHEAFHAVIDLLMTEDEYNKLFDTAYQVWGNLGMLGLEEKLAEEFRKFVQYGDNAAFVDYDAEDIKTPIIRGIVRLFRRLKALIQGLSNKQIYLNKLFYDINKGKFADRKVQEGRNLQPKFDINERELEDIKKKAIADGTFMKAPNGKPTNLNERQWLQVRTKAFKEWFGDWESVAKAVSQLKEFDEKMDLYYYNIHTNQGIIDDVIDSLKSNNNFKGLKVFTYKGKSYSFNNNLNSEEDKKEIEQLIKQGLLEKEDKWLYFTTEGKDAFQTVGFDPAIAFEDWNSEEEAWYDTRSNTNLSKDYITKAFQDLYDNINRLKEDNDKVKREAAKTAKMKAITQQMLYALNSSVSKVVDENGEPLVVYHGSDYANDSTKQGDWSNNALPYATYFAPHKYGKAKYYYSAFLNIKNPLASDLMLTQEAIQYEDIFEREILNKGYDGAISTGVDLDEVSTDATKAKEIIVINPNQIKSATDNVGTFSRENNDIRYREVVTEEEYNSMVEEMGLSRDNADTFIYNFMTKILNVNPRYKVNEKSDTLSYFYLDDPTIINQQGKARVEKLFKKILGKSQDEYLPLDFSSREAFIKSIDESLADWEQSLIQRVNNPSENSAYKEKAQTLRKIKLLQSLLNRNLDLSTFTEEEKELIGSIEGKSKKNIGFAIQKLKRQLPVIEQQIERINFIIHAMLVQAKNRLLAIHTIENIEDIIKDRLLREYDSYTIKDNTYNEKVLPNRKVVEAIKKVLDQKHREGAAILFDEKESRESNWDELYNRIITSYPEYKELLDLFHKANPELKVVVGGKAEMTVQGIVGGKFHPKSNTLYLTNESDIFTTIHELAHSATFYGMKGKNKDTESFDSSIDKFMNYIREYIKSIQANPALFNNSSVWGASMPADIYGFTNASEFIAELFGNPSFQELLDTIPAMEESKFKSLLQQVWNMIAEFLNKVFGNNKLSKSALDQAKQLGYASMSLQEQHIDLVYKQLEKYTNKAQPSISRAKTDDMSVKQYHFQKLMYINLSEEDKEYIKERGMSVRDYSSMSQAEKELFWKCR